MVVRTQLWSDSTVAIVTYYDFDNTIDVTGYQSIEKAYPIDTKYDVGFWKIKIKNR